MTTEQSPPLRFTLSDAEHHQVHALATRLLQRQLFGRSAFSMGLRNALLACVVVTIIAMLSSSLVAPWRTVLVVGAGIALLSGLVWRQRTRLRQIARERLGDEFVVVLSEVGVRVGSSLGLTTYVWTALRKAEIEGAFVLVHLRGAMVLPIPLRAFEGAAVASAEAAAVFVNAINARIHAVEAHAHTRAAALAPPAAMALQKPTTFAHALWRNVLGGFKLMFLRARGLASLQSSIGQFAALLVLAMLVSFAGNFIEVGRAGHFQWHGLREAFVFVVVCVIAAWAATLWESQPGGESQPAPQRSQSALLRGVVAMAALSLAFGVLSEIYEADTRSGWVAELIAQIAQNLSPQQDARWAQWWMWWAPWALWLWFGCASAVALARRSDALGVRKLGVGVSVLFAVLLSSWSMGNSAPLWVANVDTAATAERAAQWQSTATEAVLYRQPQLLQEALQAIAPGVAGKPELYYIGLAGAGYQDVFVNEVESVEKLLQQRFGAQGHGVLLANAMRTPLTRPFASATSLAQAFETVAQRMNVDEDVLFLFMTSHGSRKHEFQIELWPYRFESITPQRLRELLDASSIRHRVIVVSACFSGGFVPALADDDTLVITAARADRTSFGCEDGRDWTAFGQAYFAEALTTQPSFEAAFHQAAARIAERERQENRTPSEPQIAVGAKIREQIRLIEPRHPTPPSELSP